jgi:putative FmdB family regulatory protein
MPTYEYRCGKCGEIVAVLSPMNEPKKPLRHNLDGGVLERIFTAPAVTFKGSGWAKKDRKEVR